VLGIWDFSDIIVRAGLVPASTTGVFASPDLSGRGNLSPIMRLLRRYAPRNDKMGATSKRKRRDLSG